MIPFPKVAFVKLLQFKNALAPMLVTLSGMLILVSPVSLKTSSLIVVVLAGIVMLVRLLQS